MKRQILCLTNNGTSIVESSNCDGNNIPFAIENCNTNSCVEDEVTPIDASHIIREEDEGEDCESSEEEDDDEDNSVTGPTSPIVPPSWMSELMVNVTRQYNIARGK